MQLRLFLLAVNASKVRQLIFAKKKKKNIKYYSNHNECNTFVIAKELLKLLCINMVSLEKRYNTWIPMTN